MSLQSKFFIIFGVIFLSFGVLQFAINQFLILPSFIKLENNVTIQNLKRVNQSVKKELKHLDSLCHDWGAWDDSYDFIESGSIKYKEGTLTIGSFITGNLNLIYFVKPTGKVHWGKMYDLIDEKEIQLNAFSPENFPDTYASINWSHDSLGSLGDVYKRGVLLTEKGLLMLAARPILTSNNKGPIRGTLIMGRFLNESILNRLKKDTGVNFKLYICNENIPLRLQQVVKKVTYSGEHFVEKKKDNVFAYDSFPSIQGPQLF